MSGSYPPPGGESDPYGHTEPYGSYGGPPTGGWQPPGQSGGRLPDAWGTPMAPQQGPPQPASPQPAHPASQNRPDFIPPEQMHYAQQGWGDGYYYGDPTHGYPGWMQPPDDSIQNNAIFALVASITTWMCCSNIFAVGGLVCSIISLTRWRQQPESARTLNKWAWVCTGGGLVLVVLIWLALFLLPFIPLLGMGGV